jgi:hypothetical protein
MGKIQSMMTLPSIESVAEMRGSQVLKLCVDGLRDEADCIRQGQEALIAAGHITGWSTGRARAHHIISAVAEVVDRWLLDARQAETKLKANEDRNKPHALVLKSALVARDSLVVEMTRLTKDPGTTTRPKWMGESSHEETKA